MNLGIAEIQRFTAELVGTSILVMLGGMAIAGSTLTNSPLFIVVVPIAFALALVVALVTVGDVSGGHFNPAITLAALLDRQISVLAAIGYMVAQFLGGILGALGVLLVGTQALAGRPSAADTIAGIRTIPTAPAEFAFATEIILSALFVAVFLTVVRRDPARLVIMLPAAYALVHFAGIPYSAASVNPARSLGPALISTDLEFLGIYLTAPFIGAVVGWAAYRFFAIGMADETA